MDPQICHRVHWQSTLLKLQLQMVSTKQNGLLLSIKINKEDRLTTETFLGWFVVQAGFTEAVKVPGIPHERGGLWRNYSQLVHIGNNVDNCGNYPFRNLKPINPSEVSFVYNCSIPQDHHSNTWILWIYLRFVCKPCQSI